MRPIVTAAVRVAAFGLFAFCTVKAWAGGWMYAGYVLHQSGDYENAVQAYEKAQKWDPQNIRLIDQSARNWWQYAATKGLPELTAALGQYRHLTEKLPQYAQGWMYEALSELKIAEAQKNISKSQAKEILTKLQKAYQLEPNSAWMAYMTGITMLELAKTANVAIDRSEAIARIKQGTETHYPYQKSFYLDPAMERLWDMEGNIRLLEEIVPDDAFSLYAFSQFLERRGLWPYHPAVYERYLKARTELYEHLCDKGLQFLNRQEPDAAFASFQTALRFYPGGAFAKAGLLSLERIHSILSENEIEQWLIFILEQEKEDVHELLPRLKTITAASGNRLLAALWYFRSGDALEACRYFEGSGEIHDPVQMRYQAQACLSAGQRAKAAEVLNKAAAVEHPDIRFLEMLYTLDPQPEIKNKIDSETAFYISRTDWKKEENFSGAAVNLKPGRIRLHFVLKTSGRDVQNRGYAMVRLWNKDEEQWIGSTEVGGSGWQKYTFEAQTSGGWRWLQIEDYHSGPDAPGNRTAGVETGAAVIEYL